MLSFEKNDQIQVRKKTFNPKIFKDDFSDAFNLSVEKNSYIPHVLIRFEKMNKDYFQWVIEAKS